MHFHVTEKDWGDKITLYPRQNGDFRPANEPKTPRICVAPTIAQCLLALGGAIDVPTLNVYYTHSKTHPTRRVHDAYITEERWILKPAIFYFYTKISIGEGFQRFVDKCLMSVGSRDACEDQEKALPIIQRWVRLHVKVR